MPAHETQGKPPKGGLGAAAGVISAGAVGLTLLFGSSNGSSSGGGSGEHSGSGSAPTAAASHESHTTHAAITPTRARIIGGIVVYAVETSDSYAGTDLEACTPGSDGSPILLTSKSQAAATSLDALGRLTSSDIASGVLCDIAFSNMYDNPDFDNKVSSGSDSNNGVGAIFKVTLAAGGASQGQVADVERVAPKGTVH